MGAVLLAWPVWFALDGPAHLSGLVWPNVSVIGGFVPSSFVAAGYPSAHSVFIALGGYDGAPLASAAYLGWGFLAVLAGGAVAFWRDRRLWFFGFVLVAVRRLLRSACGAANGSRPGCSTTCPVLENVIEQRFMVIGFLAAAVMLAVIVDRVHGVVPDWRGALGALVLSAVCARADGRDLRRAPALRHAAGDPAPLVRRRWRPTLPPGARAPVVSRRRSRGSSRPWRGRRSTACTTARPVAAGPRGWRGGPGSAVERASRC